MRAPGPSTNEAHGRLEAAELRERLADAELPGYEPSRLRGFGFRLGS